MCLGVVITDCGNTSWSLTCDGYRKSIRTDESRFTGTGNSGVYVDCVWLLRARDTAALHLQIVSASVASGMSAGER